MAFIDFKILERGLTPGLMRKQINVGLRGAYNAIGMWWHKTMLPIHFTTAGARKYGYAPRSGDPGRPGRNWKSSYQGRKVRKHGHRRPMEWSGESKTLATSIRDVRATSRKVRVVLHANKLNFRNPHSPIRMSEEIRTVIPEEVKELTRVGTRYLESWMRSLKNSKG